MGRHTAASRQDALSFGHASKVFGGSFHTHHDDLLFAFCPCFGIVGKEYNLAGSCAGRSGQAFCNSLSRLQCGLVEYGVEQLVELLWFHAAKHGLFVNNACAEQVHGNLHHCGTCALAVTSL